MATSSFEMLLLMVMSLGGGGANDIVSVIPAKSYLTGRGIELSADKLMELAAQAPDSGKNQIQQLMALSYLASDIDLLKKSPKAKQHVAMLVNIGHHNTANDDNGFAAEYARKALAALTGQKAPQPNRTMWKDALKFMPEKATMIGFADFTGGAESPPPPQQVAGMLEMLPKQAQESIWTNIESIGNVRVDNVSFAMTFDAKTRRPADFLVRATGKFDPDRLIAAISSELKEDKDAKFPSLADGSKVRLLRGRGASDPVIVFVGNREILMGDKDRETIDRCLKTRDTGAGALEGTLKADLAKVPADVNVVVVGELPNAGRPDPVPMPKNIIAHAKRIAGGTDLNARGFMANEDDAKTLIAFVGKMRDMGLQQLNQLQGQPLPVPGLNVAAITGFLQSIELQVEGSDAKFRALVPEELLSTMPYFAVGARMARPVAPPPPPPQAQPVPPNKEN